MLLFQSFDAKLIFRASDYSDISSSYKALQLSLLLNRNQLVIVKTNFGNVFACGVMDWLPYSSSVFGVRDPNRNTEDDTKRIQFQPHKYGECVEFYRLVNHNTVVMVGCKNIFSHCKYKSLCGCNNKWNNNKWNSTYYIFESIEYEIYSITLK